jgi:hypothetical protein
MTAKATAPEGGSGAGYNPHGWGAVRGLLEAAVVTALAESAVPAGKSGTGLVHRLSHPSLLKGVCVP